MKGAPIRNFHLTMEIIEGAVILPDIIYLFKLKKSPKILSTMQSIACVVCLQYVQLKR